MHLSWNPTYSPKCAPITGSHVQSQVCTHHGIPHGVLSMHPSRDPTWSHGCAPTMGSVIQSSAYLPTPASSYQLTYLSSSSSWIIYHPSTNVLIVVSLALTCPGPLHLLTCSGHQGQGFGVDQRSLVGGCGRPCCAWWVCLVLVAQPTPL